MKPCPAPSTAVPEAMAAISARSWPEVKAEPRPVSTTAPTVSSVSAARSAAVTSWYMAVSNALRTSGRLKAMTRTPGAASSISTRGMAVQPFDGVGRRRPGAPADHVPTGPLMLVEMGQPTEWVRCTTTSGT